MAIGTNCFWPFATIMKKNKNSTKRENVKQCKYPSGWQIEIKPLYYYQNIPSYFLVNVKILHISFKLSSNSCEV